MTESTDNTQECISCRTQRPTHPCDLCSEPVCKKCVQFLPEEALSYLPKRPEALTHSRYCPACYDEQVAPVLQEYEDTLERAKEVIILSNAYRGQIPIITKATSEVKAPECADRDEVIMRLAFQAAQAGFTAVIYCEIDRKKLRNHGWEKSAWSGKGLPANLDEKKLNRNEYLEEVWRRGH